MVWQENVYCIVMATNVFEHARVSIGLLEYYSALNYCRSNCFEKKVHCRLISRTESSSKYVVKYQILKSSYAKMTCLEMSYPECHVIKYHVLKRHVLKCHANEILYHVMNYHIYPDLAYAKISGLD